MIIKVNDKKQQIIDEYYCNDIHCESYDLYCNNCKNEIKKDIDELERLIRADAIDECIAEINRLNLEFAYPHTICNILEQLKEKNND